MTDTKLLRHSLDSAASLKLQLRRALGGAGRWLPHRAACARRPPRVRTQHPSLSTAPDLPVSALLSRVAGGL